MKQNVISVISLLSSLLALALALWVYLHVDQYAGEILRRREAALVKHFLPKFDAIYADLLGKNHSVKDATTLEQLVDPLVGIVTKLGGDDTGSTNAESPGKVEVR